MAGSIELSVIILIPLAYWESLVKDVRDTYLPQNETYVYTDRATGNIA